MLGGAVLPIISVTGLIGKLGNLATLVLALSMIPLALALHQLHSGFKPGLSLAAALIGVLGMLSTTSLQFFLLLDIVQPTGVADRVDDISFAVIGVWLILSGHLGQRSRNVQAGLNGIAIFAGVGMILVTTGFLISEPPPLWGFAGGVLAIIAYPIWAISLGRKLLSDRTFWQPSG